MFLSKLLLDPQNRQVQKEIANRYELHRTLTSQFPNQNREAIGLLYRVELPVGQVYQPISLLIQTQLEPDWGVLEQKGMLLETPQVKQFEIAFHGGQRFYFRLHGNPTIRRKQPDDKTKRVGLYSEEEQEEWINRKANFSGFSLSDLRITDLGLVESLKKKDGHTFTISHLAVQFDGLLQVNDPSLFTGSLTNGIGSAKAFGFGLLSLAK